MNYLAAVALICGKTNNNQPVGVEPVGMDV